MTDFQALLSSSAVPVAAGDALVVELTPRLGFQPTVTVRTIAKDKDGNIIPAAITKTLNAAGTTESLVLEQATGVLFYASVDCQTSGIYGGELFATAYIRQGRVVTPPNNLYLTSGYVATGSPLLYPAQSQGNVSTEWSPTIQESFNDPTAGDPIGITLNNAKQCLLTGFSFQFEADSGGAGTRLIITYETNGATRLKVRTATASPLGTIVSHFAYLGGNQPADTATAAGIYFALPDKLSGLNVTINVDQESPNAGDQFSQIRAFYYSQTSF